MENQKLFQFMIYEQDHRKLNEVARVKRVSMSDIIRMAINEYLQRELNETETNS